MLQNYLGDMRIQSAYWEYFKSGGRARHQEYDFNLNNPIKDQILKDFKWGKFLIVLDHGSSQAEGYSPLFKKNTSLGIAKQNQWQQVSDGSQSTDFIGFESILNRHYKDRTQRPHPFYGGGTGESEAKEIVSTPEPWPEKTTPPPEKKQVVEKIVAPPEQEQSFMEAAKEYLGRVARGEILEENLAHYDDLLERAKAGDPEASRDMINEFAGFGGVAKVGKAAKGVKNVEAARQAGKRLGVNLDDIKITDGVARTKINISSTLDPKDIDVLKDALKSKGATKAEIDTGLIANEKLDAFLRRRVEDGKPFNGGTVRPSSSQGSDFTIDFDL
jgi:hypothetical protein